MKKISFDKVIFREQFIILLTHLPNNPPGIEKQLDSLN